MQVAAEDSVQAPEQAEDGFRSLFNGKNLDGWYAFLQKRLEEAAMNMQS